MTTDDRNGAIPLDRLLDDCVVLERQERGPREVLFLASDDRPEVVKFVAKVTYDPVDDPRGLFDLHSAIVSAGAGDCVPRPIGWGDEPPYFAYAYVDGTSVREYIERAARDPATWLDELARIGFEAGRLLARFHGCFEAPEQPVVGDSRLLELSRRVARIPPNRSDRLVRTLGDSGPHNLVVDAHGHMTMIDLDTRERWTHPESDVGVLAHRVARRAANAHGAWKPSGEMRRVLIGAVTDGYAAHSSVAPSTSEVSLAFGASSLVFAARTIRPRNPDWSLHKAARDAGWWLAALRPARRLSNSA